MLPDRPRIIGPKLAGPVEPTSVEEYAILRACGRAFGVHDMPPVNVPAQGIDAIASLLTSGVDREHYGALSTLVFLGGPEVTKRLVAALEKGGPGGPDAACQKLIQLARDRGGPDNITVTVARVELRG